MTSQSASAHCEEALEQEVLPSPQPCRGTPRTTFTREVSAATRASILSEGIAHEAASDAAFASHESAEGAGARAAAADAWPASRRLCWPTRSVAAVDCKEGGRAPSEVHDDDVEEQEREQEELVEAPSPAEASHSALTNRLVERSASSRKANSRPAERAVAREDALPFSALKALGAAPSDVGICCGPAVVCSTSKSSCVRARHSMESTPTPLLRSSSSPCEPPTVPAFGASSIPDASIK